MTLGILTIATNSYLDHWKKMVESIESLNLPSQLITFYVFTDQVKSAETFNSENRNHRIKILNVPGMRFPEASIKRYEIYSNHEALLTAKTLMHLDADMLVHDGSFVDFSQKVSLSESSLVLINHPGYWRPNGLERTLFYLKNPLSMVKDARSYLMLGGIGAWEKRSNSLAFVPRKARRQYFCGGIWGGNREAFLRFCKEMSENVATDYRNGIEAIWHDESHLNRWAANHNNFLSLDPSWCFEPRFRNLVGLKNIVEAVNKNA